jgi:hypothetical protein
MDGTDIDMQVLSAPPYAFFYWADPQLAIKRARALNEALSSTVPDEPARFVGLASAPSLTHSGRALHFLVDMVGCNRIMLGSDGAFDMCDRDPIVAVYSLVGPTQEDIEGLLGGLAAAVLKL